MVFKEKIMYKQTIRPVLFLMEPEKVHTLLVSFLKYYRHLPWCKCWIRHLYTCSDKQLIWNHLTFRNRIGLSAGFDKGAEVLMNWPIMVSDLLK